MFTPTAGVEVDANTLESDFDTVLAVFTGSPGALTEIGCNDQFAFTDQSRVDFTAKAGVTYCVLAAAWSAVPSGGSLRLTLQPSDGQAKPPVTSLALDPIGSVTPDGVATVSGTLFCEEELAFAFVRLDISQRVGKLVIRPEEQPFGEGTWRTVDVACSPPSARFSVEVVGDNGIFNAGTAHVDGQATACNLVTCSFPTWSADIKLRRTKR